MNRNLLRAIAFSPMLLLSACANSDDLLPATRPAAVNAPAEQATADYWFDQPAVASAASTDFDRLWNACSDTLVFDQFELNRQDRRLGVMTTWPIISKQFFELWRSDAGSLYEITEDSLQPIRRTVRFEIERAPDGAYVAYPKVLVEQFSHPERRITAQPQFTQAFAATYELASRVNDRGETIPNRYWYALGRDEAMEKELANAVRERVGKKFEARNPNDESSPKPE